MMFATRRSLTRRPTRSPEQKRQGWVSSSARPTASTANGARLTDDHFHNTGVPASPLVAAIDSGRSVGVRQVVSGEFNCISNYSDAKAEQCAELRFAVTEERELVRAFKTPSLRNVAERAPFMHAGQLATLAEVISHYGRAPKAPFGHSELERLRLSETERRHLEAFLRTLSAAAACVRPSTDPRYSSGVIPFQRLNAR
jgi:cytochrome c peroxidase